MTTTFHFLGSTPTEHGEHFISVEAPNAKDAYAAAVRYLSTERRGHWVYITQDPYGPRAGAAELEAKTGLRDRMRKAVKAGRLERREVDGGLSSGGVAIPDLWHRFP